jgi:agmatine/peptidylarginine deiminase
MTQQVTITEARNASYIDADGSIDCEINHPEFGWIPYTLRDDDTDTTVDNAAVKAILGSNIVAYVPPTQEELDAKAEATVRQLRDDTLAKEVDPIVSNPLRWAGMTTEEQNAWSAYRTALLNITDQAGFPHSVTWPTKPE